MIASNRNQWLDVSKGITILLMILGHTSIPDILSRFIYSFHMPLFFIASGLMTNWEKYTFKFFILKKLQSLAIPFLIYSTLVLVLLELEQKNRISSFFVQGWQGYALWFIPVLFISLLIVKIFSSCKKGWIRIIFCLYLLILGVSLRYYKISLPWSLSVVPYASFLIIIGYYLKKYQSYIDAPKGYILIFSYIIVQVVSYFFFLDMAWNNIIPVIPLTIGAITGTVMMFTLSSIIVKKLPLISLPFQYIGRETFVIVAFSQVIIIYINAHLSSNSLLKYILLLVILWIITHIKNKIKSLIK